MARFRAHAARDLQCSDLNVPVVQPRKGGERKAIGECFSYSNSVSLLNFNSKLDLCEMLENWCSFAVRKLCFC